MLYVLVATIGMKMNLMAIFVNPQIFVVGTIWMLVHAIKNPGLSDSERIVWVLVIIFVQLLGARVVEAGNDQPVPFDAVHELHECPTETGRRRKAGTG